MSKKIVLTGGGTAGHITPNIALLPRLLQLGYEISYIGSYNGMEKKLIEDYDIPYYGISTGKFRRYFDLKNFTDPFRVLKGYGEARKILKEICPDIVFSKGGFVTVPVVRAASSLKIPCVIHESDMTPGLANKLCIPVCTKVCCNFPETLRSLPTEKAVLTGSPIREELSRGNKLAALELCHFTANKPVLMVIGGSLGAASINQAVREALPKLLNDFQVVHLCGQEKIDNLLLNQSGYTQFEYLKSELKDVFAMADVVVSRAGANAICELPVSYTHLDVYKRQFQFLRSILHLIIHCGKIPVDNSLCGPILKNTVFTVLQADQPLCEHCNTVILSLNDISAVRRRPHRQLN